MKKELQQMSNYVDRKQMVKRETNIVISGLPKVDKTENMKNIKKVFEKIQAADVAVEEARAISSTVLCQLFWLN